MSLNKLNASLQKASSKVNNSVQSTTNRASSGKQLPTPIQKQPTQQQPGQPQLPEGWEMLTDQNGRVFYQNNITKQTQWDPPVVMMDPNMQPVAENQQQPMQQQVDFQQQPMQMQQPMQPMPEGQPIQYQTSPQYGQPPMQMQQQPMQMQQQPMQMQQQPMQMQQQPMQMQQQPMQMQPQSSQLTSSTPSTSSYQIKNKPDKQYTKVKEGKTAYQHGPPLLMPITSIDITSRCNPGAEFDENVRTIARYAAPDGKTTITIEEFCTLRSAMLVDPKNRYYMEQSGVNCQRLKIEINDGKVMVVPGLLQYMKGQIKFEELSKTEMFKAGVGFAVKPKYIGTGSIYLEPTYHNYLLIPINGEVIINRGLFVCCDGNIKSAFKLVGAKSIIMGGASFLQVQLKGQGWAVIKSPVPYCEIHRIQLTNEKLSVDGDNFILRKGDLKFSAEVAGNGLFAKAMDTTGEGVLDTFSGTGEVWVLPTEAVYTELQYCVWKAEQAGIAFAQKQGQKPK